jgi:hypothetical protein
LASKTRTCCDDILAARNTVDRYHEWMIARHWRGWTELQNADPYEALLKNKVLPGLKDIAGSRGGYILRRDAGDESEFVVVNLFDSIDAVLQFAGPDYKIPVLEPEAKQLLSKFEPVASHYEVRADTVCQD